MAGLGPQVPGVAPTCPSLAYPGGGSALGLPAPAGSPSGRRGPRGRVRRRRRPAGAEAGPSAGLSGSGREGARSRRAGPVSAAPCRSAGGGKRGARGGRAAAAPLPRPRRRLWPGLRGVSERGRRRGAGRGRRR